MWTLWVWIPLRRGVLDTTLCDTVCQWLATGQWFSPGTPVSSTNKTVESGIKHPNPLMWKVKYTTAKHRNLEITTFLSV